MMPSKQPSQSLRPSRIGKDRKMKSVQIPYDLFIDLAMYHLRGEDDFEEEIRQGLEQKLDAMLNRQLYSRYKTAPTKKNGSRRGRSILTGVECRRATDGLLLLGNCDRSVPRSCGWQTRQCIGCCPLASPSPSKNPQILRWMAERIFKILSACGRQR